MSMSALKIPVRVTRTRNAPTLTALTGVLAKGDSLEMVPFAKVYDIS